MKKNQKLLEMMNHLDEKYIEEAEKASFLPQKNIWKRVGGIAASLALVVAIGTFPLWGILNQPEIGPEIPNGTTNETTNETGNIERLGEYVWDSKKGVFKLYSASEKVNDNHLSNVEVTTTTAPIGSDDEKRTPNVIYPYITGEFEAYRLTKKKLAPNYAGEKLGNVTMLGKDGKTLEAELYAIVGVDTKCAVAVKYPQYTHCVFANPDILFDTFAEFKAAYSLDTELYMGFVTIEHTMADQSERLRESKDIAPLKAMILALDGKACTYEEFAQNCDMKKSIGVNVAHGSQIFSGEGLQIFADGYLVTNFGGMIHIFDIGEDAAKTIIADVKKNKYDGVEIYNEKRDVIEEPALFQAPSIPETSGGYQGAIETAEAQPPYGLMTPSYDPHSSVEESTNAAPPYVPVETVPETAIEETTVAGPLFDVNQPSYEGSDPYAWTTEETVVCETNPLIYEGYDPYAMPKEPAN